MSRLALAALAAAAVAAVTVAAAAPTSTELTACELISPTRIAAILGMQHAQVLKSIPGTSAPDNYEGVTHSVCNGVAWNGSAPSSPAGVRRALLSGRGAGFAVETWSPDEASRYTDRWNTQGFGALIVPTAIGVDILKSEAPFAPYHLRRLLPASHPGEDRATGVTATDPTGSVRVASGTWFSHSAHAIVAIGIEDAAAKPTLTQLNAAAKVAVTAFGLNPIGLR